MALRISCILLLLQGMEPKTFNSFKLPKLNDVPSRAHYVRALSTEECAVQCANDVTCASYTHSVEKQKCFLIPIVFGETLTPIRREVDQGYKSYVISELNGVKPLRVGFRLHEAESFAVAYQHFGPKSYLSAMVKCMVLGSTLAVLDTLDKWKAVIMDIKGNKDLSGVDDGFYVGAGYNEEKKTFLWFDQTPVHVDMLATNPQGGAIFKCTILDINNDFLVTPYEDCNKPLPYICSKKFN